MAATRLARRMREHDWFAAAIEVLIVIVGILIALQVSNWNEERQERARAQAYAKRLHGELQTDLANMASARRFWAKVADYQAQASDYAETGTLAGDSAWRTVLAYYQASQLRPFELQDTTFSELREGGEMRLLGDEELSKGLADYYRNTGGGMVGEILRHNPQYRLQVRGITPYAVQEYIWARCWRQLKGADQALIDCPSPIPDAEAEAILARYRATPGLIENLRFWRAQMHVSLLIVSDVERQARELDVRAMRIMPPAD